MKKIKSLVDQVEDVAVYRNQQMKKDYPNLFSTGCTTLNLACSDRIMGAFVPGSMINFVGDSTAGKSYLAQSLCAESLTNPAFAKYEIKYDNPEEAYLEGIARMFGKKFAAKLSPPSKSGCSDTVQEFQRNTLNAFSGKYSCIYVLDSLDSLINKSQEKRNNDLMKNKEVKGDYGGAVTARELKLVFKSIMRKLRKTDSILIIVSQTIMKIGMVFGNPKACAGGQALEFFASHRLWLDLREKIKVKINGKDRVIGARTHVRITKNRLTGKYRDADFCIYQDYGIDDIGSCIDFMTQEKYWEVSKKGKIDATDLELEGSKKVLIKEIEKENMERKLRSCVRRAWMDIEDKLRLKRKPRYS